LNCQGGHGQDVKGGKPPCARSSRKVHVVGTQIQKNEPRKRTGLDQQEGGAQEKKEETAFARAAVCKRKNHGKGRIEQGKLRPKESSKLGVSKGTSKRQNNTEEGMKIYCR